MTTTKSSRAMHMAHVLRKHNPSHQWSGIVKYAWYFEHLRKWMQSGIVTFSFWKSDGSIREARGTLNLSLVPEDMHPKGTKTAAPNYSIFTFFDVDKQEWRSFDITRFIGFVTVYEIQKKSDKKHTAEQIV